MSRPTASGLERALACPGSCVLPSANTSSQWAEQGTDRHEEQELAIDAGDLETMPAKVRALIPAGATVRAEVAVAYDVASGGGRELGVGLDRDYGDLRPFEIAGTIDMLAIWPGGALVGDWKGAEDVGEPERNAQVLLYALAVARAHGLVEITVAIAYLVTGRVVIATLDVFELDAFGERLRGLHLEIAAQRARFAAGVLPDVSEGKWCKYCPAAHVCPAKVALVRRLVSGAEADQLELLIPLDHDTARHALDRIDAAKALLKRIEAAVYAYAGEHTIDRGDGRYFGRHRTKANEKLDGSTVYAAALELYGRGFADQVVVLSATKSKIKEAAKASAKALGTSAAAIERSIVDETRKRGGASRGEGGERVGEYADPDLAIAPAARAIERDLLAGAAHAAAVS